MSSSKLKDVLVSPDFGHEQVSKLVTDALFFKVDNYTSKDLADDTKCSSLGRVYKLWPVKVVQFELPQPRCVVYFDLKKEECENLYPSGTLKSQSFRLGGRWFCLWTQCYTMEQKKSFGLFLKTTNDSESCTVDYEFAVMNKSSKEFQGKWEGNFNNSQLNQGYGLGDLPGISWTDFMSKDCVSVCTSSMGSSIFGPILPATTPMIDVSLYANSIVGGY